MTENAQTRSLLLAAAVIAVAILLGGLAGATIDRAIVRQEARSPYPAEQISASEDSSPSSERASRRGTMRGFGGRGAGLPPRSGSATPISPRSGMGGPGAGLGARYLDQLTRDLELSADQRAQIEELLQAQQEKLRGIRQELRQRSGAIVAETRAEIFGILTPEQRASLQRGTRAQATSNGREASHRRVE